MRTAFLAMLLFVPAGLAAQDVAVDHTGDTPVEAKFLPGGAIRMNICPGGIEVIGIAEPVIRVTATRGEAHVRIGVRDDRAEIRVTGCPHNNFRATIEIPKASAIQVSMMAGQLEVENVAGDKDVELSFGHLVVDAGKAEDYAIVTASVNSGAIDANPFAVHKGGLFRSFDQRGPGKYRLHTHVGAGQIEIR